MRHLLLPSFALYRIYQELRLAMQMSSLYLIFASISVHFVQTNSIHFFTLYCLVGIWLNDMCKSKRKYCFHTSTTNTASQYSSIISLLIVYNVLFIPIQMLERLLFRFSLIRFRSVNEILRALSVSALYFPYDFV